MSKQLPRGSGGMACNPDHDHSAALTDRTASDGKPSNSPTPQVHFFRVKVISIIFSSWPPLTVMYIL